MTKVSRIKITNFKPVREYKRDDVRIKMWTGTRWNYLCWWPYPPAMAEMCNVKPHEHTITLDFLPSNVVPKDRLDYLQKILPRLRRTGLVR